MLDYGMPQVPTEWKGEYRWKIKESCTKYRYLHLQKKGWFGIWWSVNESMISTFKGAGPFERETVSTAHDILREVKVNFNLPTGVVV